MIWEYYDGGLWNALPDGDSFRIEAHYCENDHIFSFGDVQMVYQYNLHHMTRTHPRTRVVHRIKRTILIEERPEGVSLCMCVCVCVCVCVCACVCTMYICVIYNNMFFLPVVLHSKMADLPVSTCAWVNTH